MCSTRWAVVQEVGPGNESMGAALMLCKGQFWKLGKGMGAKIRIKGPGDGYLDTVLMPGTKEGKGRIANN